jgi:hypothetical protein
MPDKVVFVNDCREFTRARAHLNFLQRSCGGSLLYPKGIKSFSRDSSTLEEFQQEDTTLPVNRRCPALDVGCSMFSPNLKHRTLNFERPTSNERTWQVRGPMNAKKSKASSP